MFGERQIKTFISDQLSAGKKNYSEDTFFQALSEVSILHFYLFRFRWEKAEYEPPVSKHENNKNPEAKLIGRINCKPVSGKKSNIEVTVNIEVKTPQFPHETHSENTILIPAVLLSPEGRQQITTWCKEKHIIYLPPRVCKLVDFINSAAEKFSSPKENEFNILYINWSYRDYPKNSFLEAWSLLTNPHNGIFTNKTVGTSIGIKPEAYKRISAVVVYTESLEGLMFNDFRYVWQRNEAGTRFRMWVIDEQLRMSEEQDCSDILFNITGMNPSKPERILMCGTKTELENLSIFKEAHKIILTHLYQQNDFS